ncbi:MAG: DNA cytosine methyltransferase [Caldilineaceae bacterium]|nr:DNA cytosine methyltransferase [Caldilineaceae bacterium]
MSAKNSYITVTDQFCGAGGSSIGAVAAGAELKLAMNHWPLAIDTHNTNFPDALHDCADMSATNPRRYPATDILITSPECTNHSLAKGVKRKTSPQLNMFGGKAKIDPSEERSRATMWDVPRFAEIHCYNIIIVENVVDARYWELWDAWLHAMDLLGYDYQIVYFNSMFAHPTPQSRDRMYVVFWRKGNRAPNLEFRPHAYCAKCETNVEAVQSWKKPERRWGRYRKQYVYLCPTCATQVEPYYYCAANAIDWSLPAPRIGDRAKPLKEKTLSRIRAGLEKFARPFLYDTVHTARDGRHQDMVWPTTGPGRTQIGNSTHGLVVPPFTVETAYSHAENDRTYGVDEALGTQTTRQTVGVVVPPFVTSLNHSTDRSRPITDEFATVMPHVSPSLVVPPYMVDLRGENAPKSMEDALSTVCASGNHHGVVMPFISSYYGTNEGSAIDDALPTVPTVDKHAVVIPPFIVSYYTRESGVGAALAGVHESLPTQPTWPVHYIAQPGETPTVDDCGFRMLQPHEIQRAMAFPSDYVVLGNGREKVKQLGNAVTPPVMAMLMERCVESLA